MRKSILRRIVLANTALVATLVGACNIETHDGAETRSGALDPACASFCLHLYDCGSLESADISDCVDVCEAKMSIDPEATALGCECVANDVCRPVSDYDCPHAPFPRNASGTGGASSTDATGSVNGTGGASNSGGASSSGGTGNAAGTPSAGAAGQTSGGTGGAAPGCVINHDCNDGEDCLDGVCVQRCSASCECADGLSCIDWYCRAAPPPATCTTDCDCPAGEQCVNGYCG